MSTAENPGWLRSRSLAFMPLVLGLVVDGSGMVMFDEMSIGIGFFRNPIVGFGLAHAVYCIVLSACMFAADWRWTSFQFGSFSLSLLSMAYLAVGGYLVLALYSAAGTSVKVGLLLAFLAVYTWWVGRIVVRMASMFGNGRWLEQVFVEEEGHIRFLQRREIDIRRGIPGLGLQPASYAVLTGGAVGVLLVIFREPATAYFGVGLVPLMLAPLGFSLGVMFFAMSAVSVLLYFVFPSIIGRRTGKTVYVDVASNPVEEVIFEYGQYKEKCTGSAAKGARR